jgi:GT2 family glycosyltransferase
MKLSIIIVNYKTPQLLLDCIRSIYQFDTSSFEFIVVDNFSNDNTEALLKEHFSDVIFVQMGYNAGFARANNAGIKMAKGAAYLLLNSDTIVVGDAINISLQKLLMADDYAGCGVQLLNSDGSPQISGNYIMTGGLNNLLPLPYVGNMLKAVATAFSVKKPHVPNATGIVDVDWINGAYLMVKRSVVDKAGLLDEDFFLYAEESEWCSRLKKYGKLCIYGDDHVIHLQGQSANDAFDSGSIGYANIFDKKGLQILLSNFVRIRKEFGVGWFLCHLFFYIITVPIFFVGLLFSKMIYGPKTRYSFLQFRGFARNLASLLSYTPRIISNRPYFYKVL